MIDLTGKKIGHLTVLSLLDERKNASRLWLCKCDCGNEAKLTTRDLNSGGYRSCGCRKGSSKSLIGNRYGSLTVISDSGQKQGTAKLWTCKCDCGNIVNIRTDSLTSGKVISCGCSKKSKKKVEQLLSGRHLDDHTSDVFFKGTLSKNNKTGVTGVCLSNGKYIAYIGYKNKTYRLLVTKDFNLAVSARKEAEAHLDDFLEWYNSRNSLL